MMQSAKRLVGLAAAAGALGVASAASAQEQSPGAAPEAQPLWELRLGASALLAPDYPASDQYHVRGVGAPLFIYRGDRIRIGADEPNAVARAIAVRNRTFELDLSVDAAYGAESKDNDARTGMPDLDTQLEIGPQLTINLQDTGWTHEGRRRLRLLLPVRHVGATDFKNYEELGFIFQPALTYRRQWPGDEMTSFSTTFALTFATEGVQEYYYEVDPAFATPTRLAYDAEGGYLGAHMQFSGRREIRPDTHLFVTYRMRSLDGAANQESPLHRENLTHAISISLVWTALRSDRAARDRD
jgi:outer membrane scaffolding protein for murein synthesis (MipA/OmpV family)